VRKRNVEAATERKVECIVAGVIDDALKFMVQQSLAPDTVTAVGLGEADPVAARTRAARKTIAWKPSSP
jgi:hypothetical protein